MKQKRDRFFALMGAILFLVTASAVSIAVFVQMITQHNNADASQANQSQQAASLAGTKLTDFTPVSSVSKLQVTDTKVGTGATVKPGDSVVVDYTGAVAATGVIFQSSKDSGQPVTLSLNQVIKGWQDGIPGMKVGGTRRLLIPANEAYGANPPQGSGIPANAALVFDITLHSIKN